MAEKKCKHCAMMIPQDAKICPHCRKKLGWSLPAKIFVGLIILGAFGALIGKNNPETPQPQKPVAAPVEIISVTSEQLYKEYEANEIAADTKYKNKSVKVSGAIRDIGKTIGDKPYLNLATGPFSHQVMVMFPAGEYDQKLATLQKGNAIEVTGTCTGRTLGKIVINLK